MWEASQQTHAQMVERQKNATNDTSIAYCWSGDLSTQYYHHGQNEISVVINPNDTETSCTINNNTPCLTVRQTATKTCDKHSTVLWRSSNVSILYKTTARSVSKMDTNQLHSYTLSSHTRLSAKSHFHHSLTSILPSKLEAKTTGKWSTQSNSSDSMLTCHLPSTMCWSPEP